jgi:cell division protein FtsB
MESSLSSHGSRKPAAGRGKTLKALNEAFWSAVCACIISYCVVSFIAGQAGLLAYKDLQNTMLLMRQRSSELQQENSRLVQLKESLRNDTDRIAIEAREIGYVRENEKMVVLKSASSSGDSDENVLLSDPILSSDSGLEPIRAGYSSGLPDEMIKMLSALLAVLVFFVSLISQVLQKRQSREAIKSPVDQPL